MRLLVTTPGDTQVQAIARAVVVELKELCAAAEIELVVVYDFHLKASYFERRIEKLGLKDYRKIYQEKLTDEFAADCRRYNPDCILVLGGVINYARMLEFLAQYRVVLWLWDSYKRFDGLKNMVKIAREVFCFEYEDVAELREKFHSTANYLPLGADDRIYHPAECARDVDISFVGADYMDRIKILEKVCARACKENWSVKIVGPFLERKNIYKRCMFRLKNSHLAKFLWKNYCPPEEAAALYRRSKICLNINTIGHHSLSPRTFEIAATKSFQLMNAGQNAHGLMNLDTDLATFDGVEDLLAKIDFYLANDDLREKIAAAGYKSVAANCTLRKSVEKLLAESQILRGAAI